MAAFEFKHLVQLDERLNGYSNECQPSAPLREREKSSEHEIAIVRNCFDCEKSIRTEKRAKYYAWILNWTDLRESNHKRKMVVQILWRIVILFEWENLIKRKSLKYFSCAEIGQTKVNAQHTKSRVYSLCLIPHEIGFKQMEMYREFCDDIETIDALANWAKIPRKIFIVMEWVMRHECYEIIFAVASIDTMYSAYIYHDAIAC